MLNAVYKKPFIGSVIFHLALLIIFCVSIHFQSSSYSIMATQDIVHATVMNAPSPAPTPSVAPPQKIEQKKVEPKEVAKKIEQKKTPPKPVVKPEKALKQTVVKVDQKKQKEIKKKTEARLQELAKIKKEKEAKEKALAAAEAARVDGIVDKYKSRILASIAAEWLIPSSADKTMSCQLLVQLSSKGEVLNVQVMQSSQNVQLDRSAVAAVYKASPLPVPREQAAFEPFKRLIITMRPETLMG